MGKHIEQLNAEEARMLVQEMLDKRLKVNKKSWTEIIEDYDLDCSSEMIRKISVGVEVATNAGMKFSNEKSSDAGISERRKLYDIQRDINKRAREISRSELLCEIIQESIKNLPAIKFNYKERPARRPHSKRDLIVGLGDFHFGASFEVKGLKGETINKYNSDVFENRMSMLSEYIAEIAEKENPEQITLMIVGDMLDGMLRSSQLQRLEYGVVESAMRLSESLAIWLADLYNSIGIPIRVYAVRGNHGETRPLGSKAGQFPEENMERIVMHYLFARFMGSEYVKIACNDAPLVQLIDVYGYQFVLTHGQGVDIESMAKDYINLYNKPIDVFMVGHLHNGQTFVGGIMSNSNILVERIPSICGTDPYGYGKGYRPLPGATVILMEEGYGRRCVYPILLK